MDLKMPYSMILGRLFLKKTKAVESIHYLKHKFRASEGIGVMWGDQKEATTCFAISSKRSYYIDVDKENAKQ